MANAHGGWTAWEAETEPYRKQLAEKIKALETDQRGEKGNDNLKARPLVGRGDFPLVEMDAPSTLGYLWNPALYEKSEPVKVAVTLRKWLAARGIDLIIVPAPKMTQIYSEAFIDGCPADGVISPHVQRALLGMLRSDVEVIDGFSLFRPLRDPNPDFLYNSTEPHWSPRGQRVMAKEVADRICRYRFGARARYGLPAVRSSILPFDLPEPFPYSESPLTPEAARRAADVQPKAYVGIADQNGNQLSDDPKSPVLLVGNSFLDGFHDALIREINLPVRTIRATNSTTEPLADFLRDDSALAHARVVVWVTSTQHLGHLKPLPQPMLDSVTTSRPNTSPAPAPSSPH
jgi:hypothetical protein